MQEQIYQPQNNALIDWLVYSMKKKFNLKNEAQKLGRLCAFPLSVAKKQTKVI